MKYIILFAFVFILAAPFSCSKKESENEKIIQDYFSGWVKKDWNIIANLLTPDFTFTSPNNDDHIPTEKFKAKCWVQANYIQKFNFDKFSGSGDGTFVTYECFTKDNHTFRNTEYFTFNNGKIKAIEVFFGAGRGFPTNDK